MMNFLVRYDINGDVYTTIENEYQIFTHMDMADCSGAEIVDLYSLDDKHYLEQCEFLGKWHNQRDPECMEIIRKSDGSMVAIEWGTDH